MKINFSQVYEGWKNNLFPSEDMKPLIEEVAKDRMKICNDCPKHSKNHSTARPDNHCTECGCTLVAKVRCLSCICPLEVPSWMPVLDSVEKEYEIKNAINGKA
jgi:hypothetical protein